LEHCIHCVFPVPCKGQSSGAGRDNVARGTSKGHTFCKRYQAQPEYNRGITNRGPKERLWLGSSKTLNKIFGQSVQLQFAKKRVRASVRLRKMRVRILWRGSAPSKTKEETTDNSLRATDVGTLTIFGTFSCTNRKKDDGDKPGPARTLSGSHLERAALKLRQWGQLESNHCEN
jgi:hypothetical protein